ncbi:MAG: SDR family NAD(P)-dependent oxidoreductase [Nitrospinae bacterium]|nr:SDR family NAD(P)-dependent oxidoreductase [Nitrospinota bacterium]
MRFENKTIIITGAGGGIGRASALRLAREGAHVVCMDIAESREETVKLIKEDDGGDASSVAYDALNSEDVKRVFQETISTHGSIDGLVNCVGAGLPLSALEIDEEAFDKMFDMNVKTTYRACWAVLPHMQERRSGRIVNFSSVAGRSASVLQGPHYSSAKAAVIGLTRHLAREFGPHNINVNAIAPGVIGTDRILEQMSDTQRQRTEGATPLGRIGSPDDIAGVVAFLASEDARHVTGVTIDVNGGFFLA